MVKTYAWPDGSKGHSIPWNTHLQNVAAKGGNTAVGQTLQGQPLSAFTPAASKILATGAGVQKNTGLPGAVTATTPQPYDPSVEQAAIIGGRNVAIGNGNAAYDQGNLSFDYGYNPDGSVNTANPYSRAALYQLAYTNSKRKTLNGMASEGQLYSGAYGTAQNLNDTNYARNEAANRLGYQRAAHGIQAGQLTTYANAGTGVSDADFAALLKATYPSGG